MEIILKSEKQFRKVIQSIYQIMKDGVIEFKKLENNCSICIMKADLSQSILTQCQLDNKVILKITFHEDKPYYINLKDFKDILKFTEDEVVFLKIEDGKYTVGYINDDV